MAEVKYVPFSIRNGSATAQIDNDFPETARTAVLHLLHKLVNGNYVNSWQTIAQELERIGRVKPRGEEWPPSVSVERLLYELPWERIIDFCERLHSDVVEDVYRFYSETDDSYLAKSKSAGQKLVAEGLQLIFVEENLAFEFSEGSINKRGRHHTLTQIAKVGVVLGDSRLKFAREHYNKALQFYRNVTNPDYENTIKEAVCAVESTARELFPQNGKTLGDNINALSGEKEGQIPKSIAKTFHGVYGFRSAGKGVGHGGAEGGAATKELAEYVLSVAASQIIYLVDFAASLEPDIPF